MTAQLTRDGTRFRLSTGDVALTVDAAIGARVVEFSRCGRNVLTTSAVHPKNHGSTFWPSPQSAWGWPPPPEIDGEPYRARADGARVVVDGAPSRALGVAVSKSFRVTDAGVAVIEYTMTNRGASPIALAPWEVTRVPCEGVTFFPSKGRSQPPGARPPPAHAELDGVVWIAHGGPVPEDQKLYAEGARGWIAHAAAGTLFVKAFPPLSPAGVAPGEAELEVFVNREPRYVELEQQGALLTLEPAAAATWTVTWHLVALSPEIPLQSGATELVAAVDAALIAG